MNKKIHAPTLFGACSLLVIFCILCLAVFSVLALSTAGSGQRLSEASAQKVMQYNLAEAEANRVVALLRSGVLPEGVTQKEGVYTFSVQANEAVELFVEISISQADNYRVHRWQFVRTAPWEADDDIQVLDPK